jgi:hypothetical protein
LLSDVRIFPNPANEMIQIEGLPARGKTIIYLFDMRGNTIYTESSVETGSLRISTGALSPGLYTLKDIT